MVSGSNYGLPIHARGTQAIVREMDGVQEHLLGWKLPPGVTLPPGPPWPGAAASGSQASLLVNNGSIRVLVVTPTRPEAPGASAPPQAVHVFDKATGEWSSFKLPGPGVADGDPRRCGCLRGQGKHHFPMRAFGEWLAVEDTSRYQPGPIGVEPEASRRTGEFRTADERFDACDAAPTGRFRLYNPRVGNLVVHDTNEPDSEVLYVDGADVAWYRVRDELRKAKIENGELKGEQVVVKAPEIRAVHWLFFGKE